MPDGPNEPVVKIECKNHILRNFRGAILELGDNTKLPLPDGLSPLEAKPMRREITVLRGKIKGSMRRHSTAVGKACEHRSKETGKTCIPRGSYFFGKRLHERTNRLQTDRSSLHVRQQLCRHSEYDRISGCMILTPVTPSRILCRYQQKDRTSSVLRLLHRPVVAVLCQRIRDDLCSWELSDDVPLLFLDHARGHSCVRITVPNSERGERAEDGCLIYAFCVFRKNWKRN
jgi:hypothetical protein